MKKAAAGKAVNRQQAISDRKRAINKELRTGPQGYNANATKRRYMQSQNAASRAAGSSRGKGSKAAQKAATMQAKAAQTARAKTFSGKAAPNKAKAAYKAATSKAREAKMLAGGRTSARGLGKRQDAGAQRIRASVKAVQAAQAKVRAMEKKRGVGGRKRKG